MNSIRRCGSRRYPLASCILHSLLLVTACEAAFGQDGASTPGSEKSKPSAAAIAQQPATPTLACNNQARTLTTQQGETVTAEQSCTSVSVTVNVAGIGEVGFETPESCPSGKRVQSEDCFDCGPASQGNHCTARGFKANVKTYTSGSGNPCPSIPEELPSTIEELNAIFSCKPLALDGDTDVWCASVRSCSDGQLESIYTHAQALTQANGSPVVISLEDPDPFLSAGQPSPGTAEAFFAAAQTLSTSQMPTLLAQCLATYAPLPAVGGLHANVTLEHHRAAPESPVVNTFSLSGMMAADGRHVFLLPSRGTLEGAARVVIQELAFDGITFFEGYQGEPYYRAYSSASAQQARARGLHERYLSPLEQWVANPLRVLRFPGTAYSVSETPEGLVLITESYAGTGIDSPMGLGTTTYTIDVSSETPHVTRIEIRSDQGALTRRRDFSDFQTLENGVWRPRLIREEFHRTSSEEPWLIKTVQILRANVLGASEFESDWWRPKSDQNWWYVHI